MVPAGKNICINAYNVLKFKVLENQLLLSL